MSTRRSRWDWRTMTTRSSYFADCQRDERGRCLAVAAPGDVPDTVVDLPPTRPEPSNPGGDNPPPSAPGDAHEKRRRHRLVHQNTAGAAPGDIKRLDWRSLVLRNVPRDALTRRNAGTAGSVNAPGSARGKPCGPGQTAERSGCIPHGASAEAQAPKPARGLGQRIARAVKSKLGVKEAPQSLPWKDVDHLSVSERVQVSPSYHAFAKGLDAKYSAEWEVLAQEHGGDVGKAQKHVAGKIQKLTNSLRPHIRVCGDSGVSSDQASGEARLMQILEGGFKNQFQTGKSSALNAPRLRRKAEDVGMGVPPEAPAEEHPVYGYMGSEDVHPDSEPAADYGCISVRLKPEVRQRTTVSVGDSLQGAINGEFQSAPAHAMTHQTMCPAWLTNAGGTHGLDSYESFNKVYGKYVEAQMMGGVGPKDVEHVQFAHEPSEQVRKKLKEMKIPWSVYRKEQQQ